MSTELDAPPLEILSLSGRAYSHGIDRARTKAHQHRQRGPGHWVRLVNLNEHRVTGWIPPDGPLRILPPEEGPPGYPASSLDDMDAVLAAHQRRGQAVGRSRRRHGDPQNMTEARS
jgi:hypothetical protein